MCGLQTSLTATVNTQTSESSSLPTCENQPPVTAADISSVSSYAIVTLL